MSEQNRKRVRELFMDLSELPTAQWRAALEAMTGESAEVRAEVARLLELDAQARGENGAAGGALGAAGAGGFMENPTATTLPVLKPISEKVGSKIGVYKLLEVIGEGGFGTVFMAEQSVPVRRRVALKIIKLGMDTRQVVARFEQERQALALMDHPNIAKVYDAGATETGRPFFVMEYVRGEQITKFVAERKLTLRARLELLLQVCRAVQHAHTKGVIHRDIKPSNVLVSVVDGKPLAKVIDFGIAKATGAAEGRLTEMTLFTEHRQLIGTLEYMSPEQVEGSADIDTRSDVYGLGVLLYEMLTGETPIDGRRLRSAAHAEIQRIIREEDPQVPSVRVTGSVRKRGASAAGVKEGSGGEGERDPRRMRSGMADADEHVPRMLRGELDWIVMKALEKDRGRRYESPSELAEDIERHLTGQPVQAAPVSKRYRLMKFVRRNRAAVVGGVAVSAALLVGLAGTAWKWRDAVRSEREAVTQAELAGRNAMQAQLAREEAERKAEEAATYAVAVNLAAAQSAMRSDEYAEARRLLELVPMERRGWEHAYLMKKARGVVWASNFGGMREPEFSPDGCLLATNTELISLREGSVGSIICELPSWQYRKFNRSSTLLATSPSQGEGAASGSERDEGIVIYDVTGHKQSEEIRPNAEGELRRVAFAFAPSSEILTINARGEGTWWSVNGKKIRDIGTLIDVEDIEFNGTGDRIVAKTVGGQVELWTVDQDRSVERWRVVSGASVQGRIRDCMVEDNNKIYLYDTQYSVYHKLNIESSELTIIAKLHGNLRFSPDGCWAHLRDLDRGEQGGPLAIRADNREIEDIPRQRSDMQQLQAYRDISYQRGIVAESIKEIQDGIGVVSLWAFENTQGERRTLAKRALGISNPGPLRLSPDGRHIIFGSIDNIEQRMAVLSVDGLNEPMQSLYEDHSYWLDSELWECGLAPTEAVGLPDGSLVIEKQDTGRRFVITQASKLRVETKEGYVVVDELWTDVGSMVSRFAISADGSKIGISTELAGGGYICSYVLDAGQAISLEEKRKLIEMRQKRGRIIADELLAGELPISKLIPSLAEMNHLEPWERFEAADALRIKIGELRSSMEGYRQEVTKRLLDPELIRARSESESANVRGKHRRMGELLANELAEWRPGEAWIQYEVRLAMIENVGGEENARRGVRLMREIMQKNAETVEMRITLALSLYRQGEFKEALREIEQARSWKQSLSDWEEMLYAIALKKSGREEDAIRVYHTLMERHETWEQNSFVTTLAGDMKELFEPAGGVKAQPEQPK